MNVDVNTLAALKDDTMLMLFSFVLHTLISNCLFCCCNWRAVVKLITFSIHSDFLLFFFPLSPPPSASLPAGPPPQVSPDEAEQQAVHLLACSADMLPAPLPPISMFDLLEALQVRKNVLMCAPGLGTFNKLNTYCLEQLNLNGSNGFLISPSMSTNMFLGCQICFTSMIITHDCNVLQESDWVNMVLWNWVHTIFLF